MASELCAKLQTIHAADIRNRLQGARSKLIEAASRDGMFYLDLTEERDLQECLVNIQDLMQHLFGLDMCEKERYDIDRSDVLRLNG
jgi:isopenicillin N synthase-like dioxygenase